MKEFSYTPESISYKELNVLLSKAHKSPIHAHEESKLSSDEQVKFEELITNWQALSEDLLMKLNNKNNYVLKERTSQSLMALGALEAHLKLAVQAKQASDLN